WHRGRWIVIEPCRLFRVSRKALVIPDNRPITLLAEYRVLHFFAFWARLEERLRPEVPCEGFVRGIAKTAYPFPEGVCIAASAEGVVVIAEEIRFEGRGPGSQIESSEKSDEKGSKGQK